MSTFCDSEDSTATLLILGLVGLVLTFCGYLIYRLAIGLFGFILGFLAEAAVGAVWLGETVFQTRHAEGSNPGAVVKGLTSSDLSDPRVQMRVIVLACCLIWGTIVAVIFVKLSSAVNKFVGFVLGAAVGAGLVVTLILVVKDPVNEALGETVAETYGEWDMFAMSSLGVPIALVTGYIARNSVKYSIMLATALGGAGVVVGTAMRALECADVNLGEASTPAVKAPFVAVLAIIGLVVQVAIQPKEARERKGVPTAPCV